MLIKLVTQALTDLVVRTHRLDFHQVVVKLQSAQNGRGGVWPHHIVGTRRYSSIEHAAHLGDLNEAIAARSFVSGILLGEPSAELRAMMAESEVRLFTPYQSM